ncbi:lipoprotein-releasing system permease protein [Inquilinus ginsengisoli]|uniref:Lipoprotein-releasing system permease protein n=1 Tax=Inquilinus ginsengisoli TaxID=363840 RepID=A0ABU1JUU4_9PROT|nr:lipoprotein-releasing ABC transporter permease subunit [Inquilinus ginsengisoli]MDR6291319.1 lipoprotein-releasing system permease protein [Inquilinus ginsengisoli]
MFNAFERTVAFRYLRARRKQGFVSVIAGFSLLGIVLGVATLITVTSVMNGFRTELLARFLGLNAHVSIYALGQSEITDYAPVAGRLRGVDGVTQVLPVIQGMALASAGSASAGVQIRGERPEDFLARPLIARDLQIQSPGAFAGTEAVAIGKALADKLGVGLGGRITLLAPGAGSTGQGEAAPDSSPKVKAFTVVAIFEAGLYEFDSGVAVMPLEAAQSLLQMGGGVTRLDLFVRDPDRIAALRDPLQQATGPGFRFFDWQQALAGYLDIVEGQRNVIFVILSLIVLVAAFNIISSLIMLVKDKGGDIAILRTMGATRGAILRIFFMTGAIIGAVGTLVGLGLGVALADNLEPIRQGLQSLTGMVIFDPKQYSLTRIPTEINAGEVLLVCGMALALSFLASIYPAWRAARLDPVEALRYE